MPKPPRTPASELQFRLPDGRVMSAAQMLQQAGAPPSETLPEADLQAILDALLLLGGKAPIAHVAQWLQMTDRERVNGQPFTVASVRDGLRQLRDDGRAESTQSGMTIVHLAEHADRLQQLLMKPHRERLWRQRVHLLGAGRGDWQDPVGWLTLRSTEDATSALRLMLFSGMGIEEFHRHLAGPLHVLNLPHHIASALTEPWLPQAMSLMDAELRDGLMGQILDQLPAAHPLRRQMCDWLHAQAGGLSIPLRVRLAEDAMLALEFDRANAHLAGLEGPGITLLAAMRAFAAGHWAEAATGFEAAIKAIHAATRSRRGALSLDLTRPYLLSLLAQDDPKRWEQARKYAIAESGTRTPSPYDDWGLWAHAIGCRLGHDSPIDAAFQPRPGEAAMQVDRLLLIAWLGRPATGWTAPQLQANYYECWQGIRKHFKAS